jgi:2-polyprenyl-6-methoxyphenol hydroxylase-like FAD-dependent oxidoreductase
MQRDPPTNIDILVVGGGIGGLAFAIEAYRKGHKVRVIERNPQGQYSGMSLCKIRQ